LEALITVWIAAIGLSIGSFLNVVIARLPDPKKGTPEYADLEAKLDAIPEPETWWQRWKLTLQLSGWAYKRLVWPRSRCPKCGHQLAWYENIPVVSWVALRGKCSNCKTPISPRYIFVELVTGTLFVVALSRYGFDWRLVSALVFFTFLIPLIFIDAEHWILPFELTLPAIAAGLVLPLVLSGPDAFRFALEGAVAAFLLFRVMELFGWLATGREALGAGDKYLMAMIGAQVGWRGLLGVILLSSLQGAVVGLVRMRLTGRAGPTPDEKPEEPKVEAPKSESSDQEKPAGEEEEEESTREKFTPEFLKPGLKWWHRLLAIPYTIFLQDIPDSPPPDETTGEVPDWEPQANNIPFGPWIGLAGIEVMLLGPFFVERLAHTQWRLLSEVVFGL
jgi:leader peptidase (prepilin peptidase)/N-methyltransferase